MEKAFALPLVNATYDSLASLATPLQVGFLHGNCFPWAVDLISCLSLMQRRLRLWCLPWASPMTQSRLVCRTRLDKTVWGTFTYFSVPPQVPDVVTAKVTDAKGQVRFGKTLIALVNSVCLGWLWFARFTVCPDRLLFALVDFWFALIVVNFVSIPF